MVRRLALPLGLLAVTTALLSLTAVEAQLPGPWQRASATFYGGADASGTADAACGYGNPFRSGYGTMTAAASIAMWDKGAICGSCWEIKCIENPRYCRAGASVVVTVTNQCPQGSEGGWCNIPNQHMDMAEAAFMRIANDFKVGVIRTNMRRVPCPYRGGVTFSLNGNPFWTQVVVTRVAGSGDISSLEVSQDGGRRWNALSRNWGSVWSTGGLLGRPLSWRLTSRVTGEKVTLMNCIGSRWYLGGTYGCSGNFR